MTLRRITKGRYIQIFGQFRSYNRHEEKKNRLVLSIFAREISFVEEESDKIKSNQIFLDGYICKTPVYRRTPLGREIADMLLAVNRPMGNQTIFPAFAGEETPGLLPALKWAAMCRSGAEYRAGST